MIRNIEIQEHKAHSWGHFLSRIAGYCFRICVAVIGIVLTCVAFLVTSPFALYDSLSPDGRRRRRECRAYRETATNGKTFEPSNKFGI